MVIVKNTRLCRVGAPIVRIENEAPGAVKGTFGEMVFSRKDVLVADGIFVLIKQNDIEQKMHTVGWNYGGGFVYYMPIIISETEKIGRGDYFMIECGDILKCSRTDESRVYFFEERDRYEKHVIIEPDEFSAKPRKIIVLSEQFSPDQRQEILDNRIKDGEKVLVECEELKYLPSMTHMLYSIKSTSQCHVTLYKTQTQTQTYTLEDLERAFEAGRRYDNHYDCNASFVYSNFQNWIEKTEKH